MIQFIPRHAFLLGTFTYYVYAYLVPWYNTTNSETSEIETDLLETAL